MTDARELRTLVLAPVGRDGPLLRDALAGGGLAAHVCRDAAELCAGVDEGAGALLVTEEALGRGGLRALTDALDRQPPWSDLSTVVITGGSDEVRAALVGFADRASVSLVERPARVWTVLSAVRAAVQARRRQYEARDLIAQREALLAEAEAARRSLAEASRAKDDFLAAVSHELRTPLTAILGWAAMLRGGAVPEGARAHALATIERNARAQAQLVEDLLDVSRVIEGRLRLDVREVALGPVVAAAVDALRPAAAARGVRLEAPVGPAPGVVRGDPDRLLQVVTNLLSNAVKFTPGGGQVRVELRRDGADLEVSVTDTGQGIRPDFLPHVFERFRQADGSIRRSHGGLGLGLAIVRHLVELHGGAVSAHSDGEGRGARFVVRLPAAPEAADAPGAPAPREAPPGARADVDGLRVLVVDDEPDARELLVSVLESCGARVASAAGAEGALEEVRRGAFDVIVSDVGMPGEDGYALLGRIRRLPASQGGATPAVALTAYARAEDRERALAAGFDAHLAKPVEPATLLAAVAGLARR